MQLPAVRGRRIRRTLADAVSADGARRRGDRVRVVAWSLEGGGHVDVCSLAEAARLALVEGDEAMAERILAQAPEGDRTPEIIQLVAELRFRRGHDRRGRGAARVDRPRRARRSGPQRRSAGGGRRTSSSVKVSTHVPSICS